MWIQNLIHRRVRDMRIVARTKKEMEEIINLKVKEHSQEIVRLNNMFKEKIRLLEEADKAERQRMKKYYDKLLESRDEAIQAKERELILYKRKVSEILSGLRHELSEIRQEVIFLQEMDAQREGHLESIHKQIGIFSDRTISLKNKTEEIIKKMNQFQHKTNQVNLILQ
jgi:ABC-type anion transport system duplicated permease subunit